MQNGNAVSHSVELTNEVLTDKATSANDENLHNLLEFLGWENCILDVPGSTGSAQCRLDESFRHVAVWGSLQRGRLSIGLFALERRQRRLKPWLRLAGRSTCAARTSTAQR